MKKVCIVTLYGNFNLGNKLQNYAVQQKCVEYGCNPKTIKNYNSSFSHSPIIIKCINHLRRAKHFVSGNKMYTNKCFKKFQKEFLLIDNYEIYSNEINTKLNKKYDYFIVGSDQVWNPYFGLKGDLAFLELTDKNKIAFSASIGVDDIPEEQKEKYINGLKGLDYISVREDMAKTIVEELTNRDDVEVLLDPTMLLTKEEWKKVYKRPEGFTDKKYILTYFLGNMAQEIKENIEKYAKENNLEIIDVMEKGVPKSWIGPSEFIYLEEHAELICTDSFHSCVFGILMETPFIIFDRQDNNKKMNSRIDTLLSKFNLQSRKYSGILTKELLQCDFSHCEKILEEERKKAEIFLRKGLGDNKNE